MKLKFSPLVDKAAGKDGGLVVRRTPSGPIATPRTNPKKSASVRSSSARNNLGTSSTEFTKLPDASIEAWNRFGASRVKSNDVNGVKYGISGIAAYNEFATVFKMVSPGVATPTMPPTTGFSGDPLQFTLTASTSTITVSASGPTSAGKKLEVAVASLSSRARKIPTEGYVSQGFFKLEAEKGNKAEVTVPASIYAVQVRYVSTTTGQSTGWQLLGKTTVALSTVEGGVDQETGEVFEPKARAPRMKKAA